MAREGLGLISRCFFSGHSCVSRLSRVAVSRLRLGYGTAIASLISGVVDGSPGLAPEAEILSIRVLDVINLSLGYDTGSQVLQNAVAYARKKGVLVVAAVGNDGTRSVTFSARYEGVVGVTSVDAKGRQSPFANYGEEVDVAVPGVDVYAAWSGDGLVFFSGTSSSPGFVSGALAAEISVRGDSLLTSNPEFHTSFSRLHLGGVSKLHPWP